MAQRSNCAMPLSNCGQRGVPWLVLAALSAVACNLLSGRPTPNPTPLPSPVITPVELISTPSPPPAPTATLPFPDASALLAGVCFSFLETLDGQTVVLDSPRDLAAFYDQVDSSKRCRDTVTRQQFDFSSGQIIGTVITGMGCTVGVSYEGTERDDQAHQRTVVFRASVGGDCPYQLVHPLWLLVERPLPGYTTRVRVSRSP
jgi:hypothetical protein